MGQIEVDCDQSTSVAFSGNFMPTLKCPAAADIGILACISSESFVQMHLLMQAQMLIRKNDLYEAINQEISGLYKFQPTVFTVLPCRSAEYKDCEEEDGLELPLLSFHRDVAIGNLRFLSIFYNSGPNSFYVATNLMDCLLSKIVVTRKALPIVATCCFYLATCCTNESSIPIDLNDLMKLTQCEMTKEIFHEVSSRIRDEIGFCQQRPVTPLSFLRLFYSVFELQDELLQDSSIKTFLISRLELLLCQFEFTKFRYDLLVLAFLQYFLQQIGFLSNSKQLTVLELRYYCRMDEDAFRECFSAIERYTFEYETQTTKRPKLKLTWTISRRVLLKRRPSLLVRSNLEPVMEEESPEDANSTSPIPHGVTSESLRSEVSEPELFHVDCEREMGEAKSCDGERSSDYQDDGDDAAVNNWKKGTDLAFSEGGKSVKREELPGKDAPSMDEKILCISSGGKFIDGSDYEMDERNGDGLGKIRVNGTDGKGELDKGGFNINESCLLDVNNCQGNCQGNWEGNRQDLMISNEAGECESKAYCSSFLDLEPNADDCALLVPTDGCTQSSFESPSSIGEGENDDTFIADTVADDESSARMSGRNASAGNGASCSKVCLSSSDVNNNCIMGII